MSAPRLTLHIDRVVLRGIDPLNQRAFASGLESTLARVLSDPAMRAAITQAQPQGRATPVLRLGRLPLDPGQAGARSLGNSIARAIGKQVSR